MSYTDDEVKDIRAKAKELGINNWHNSKPETLLDKIAKATPKEEVKEPVESLPAPPEPVVSVSETPIDVANPDAQGLEQRQEKASTEARLKALENALLLQQDENQRLNSELAAMEKKPTVGVPEKPNPNTMVYFKDGVDKKGKDIIAHKQVSFAEAKILLATDEYKKSPAGFNSEE
jgi:hypothetical protein